MIAVIEAVFQFQFRVCLFAGDHPHDIGDIATWRLFTKHMQAFFQPGDGGFGIDVVCQANEQDVQVFLQQRLVMGVVTDPVFKLTVTIKRAVTDSDSFKIRMTINIMTAPFADDTVTGDADTQFFTHRGLPCIVGSAARRAAIVPHAQGPPGCRCRLFQFR